MRNALLNVTNGARIPTLDGWRAVAIAAVLVSHGFNLAESPSRSMRAVSYAAGHLGALGVALFFAISAYLITTLLLEERDASGFVSLKAFYIRRAFRILPPAFLYLLALWLVGKPLANGEIASAALFFSNYWPHRQWFTQHFWSLSMEEHFYFLWPVALVWLQPRRAVIAAGILITTVTVWRPWSLSHLSTTLPALQRTDMRVDAFLYAAVLAAAMHSQYRERVESWLRPWWVLVGIIVSLAATVAWGAAGSAPSIITLAQSALLPLLLVATNLARGSALYRFLESVPVAWMGRISYGLYLWQQLFLVSRSARTPGAAVIAFIPQVLVVFAAAIASYYLLERPLRQYGRKVANKANVHPHARSPQVSWSNEPHASNSQGVVGVRAKTRSQATGSSLH